MKQHILLTIALAGLSLSVFSQRATTTTSSRYSLTRTDQTFVQDAINSNNEAMTLAQMALRQSKTNEVKQIARQILLDHASAQKKLYAIAHLKDSVSYGRANYAQNSGAQKLPLSDNLDSRRNRTVTSIANNKTSNSTSQPTTNSTNPSNAIAGTATNRQSTSTNTYDTSSRFGVNQTFNNNTSIDNANGINNPVRTEIGSASGRWTENTTVINNQPVAIAAQPVTSGITAPPTGNDVTNGSAVVNNINNTPTFPSRPQDTVRMSGRTDGFQDPGTNLSFPGNYRYANTTPNTPANSNAGSDYGVQTGVVVNNPQTNALNTAPYSNNEINANIVQTGQQQGTYNPTAVINSSSTSLNNTQVAVNNANANRANDIAVKARPMGTAVTNPSGQNVAATNSIGNNKAVITDSATGAAPILVGRSSNRRAGGNNTSGGTPNMANSASTASTGFYTNPTAITSSVTTLQNTQPDAFDKQWITQMTANQQLAAQQYAAAARTTRQSQIKTYINTTLPLLQGHQYALKQWQQAQAK